jgi:hypothetical protein
MLAITTSRDTHLIPPSTLNMHPRGRSRDVSSVALARQASEERRRTKTSIMSCYPLPSDPEKHTLGHFYLSPSSLSSSPTLTPLALTPPDPAPLRVHPPPRLVPLDNSHAPIDPREPPFKAQIINPQPPPYPVQSRLSSPLASSPLVEKSALQVEAVHHAREQARAKCRYETLARAEQVFATILERSRRERLAALLLRTQQEGELKGRERAMRDLEKLEHERVRHRSVNYVSHAQRSGFRVLSRVPPSNPTSQPRQPPDRFFYTFPVPSMSPANSAPMRQHQGVMRTRSGLSALTIPNSTNTRGISFDDIRASMGNSLFPHAHGELVSAKTRRESELLGALLEPVRWEEGERWYQRGRVIAGASRVPEIVPECEACASASLTLDGFSAPSPQTPLFPSPSVSTPTSITSRPISWLSFGSRKSASSIDTAQINHPPSSPGRPRSRHSCGCARRQSFVAVDLDESPLCTGAEHFPVPVLSAACVHTDPGLANQRPRKASFSARTWLAMQSSVTSVLSAVVLLQPVRVSRNAATLATPNYAHDARSSSETFSGYAGRPLSGWRARRSDVTKFTSSTSHIDSVAVPYLVFHLIEIENIHRSSPSMAEAPKNLPAHDSLPPHPPTYPSTNIPPTYYDADRHIFNANPLHLLSRAQINSWRFRGMSGAMPPHVYCRPELFYRLEHAGGPPQETKGGSPLKWGWRVVWDTDDRMEC